MRNKSVQLLLVVSLALFALSGHAWAGTAGSTMPWDNAFTVLSANLTGPLPKTLSLIGIATTGMMLLSGAEINHFSRAIIILVFVCSLLVGANNLMSAFGWGAGAEVTGNGSNPAEAYHAEAYSHPSGRRSAALVPGR
jgi:type IV secretory pathway VirB2 component (pilin)